MKKNMMRLMMIVMLLFIFVMPAFASGESFTDTQGHWAEATIADYHEQNFVSGYGDGSFMPNRSVTRAEFAVMVNKIFNYHAAYFPEEENIEFSDTKEGQWFYQDILTAYRIGCVSGYPDGTFKPNQEISRQEAAAILAKIYSLQEEETAGFNDLNQVSPWALASVNAVAEAGYINGYPDGNFQPKKAITRAETVAMLSHAAGLVYSEEMSGTVGEVIEGNVTINHDGVHLQNLQITGDLYITEGVGLGDVTLNGVTVDGSTLIKGGGENSIHIISSKIGIVILDTKTGNTRIVAEGTTQLSKVVLNSGGQLEESDLTGAGFENCELSLTIPEGEEVIFHGDFDTITVNAPQTQIKMTNGTIGEMNLSPTSTGTTVDLNKNVVVENLKAEASVSTTGEGTIEKAEVTSEGVQFEQDIEEVVVSEEVKEVVVGEKVVKESITKVISSSSGGGSSTSTPQVAGIQSNLPAGSVPYGSEIELSTSTVDTVIYYTLDGSIPSADNGSLYNEALTVNEDTTIKAIGIRSGYKDSSVATYTYSIGSYLGFTYSYETIQDGQVAQSAQYQEEYVSFIDSVDSSPGDVSITITVADVLLAEATYGLNQQDIDSYEVAGDVSAIISDALALLLAEDLVDTDWGISSDRGTLVLEKTVAEANETVDFALTTNTGVDLIREDSTPGQAEVNGQNQTIELTILGDEDNDFKATQTGNLQLSFGEETAKTQVTQGITPDTGVILAYVNSFNELADWEVASVRSETPKMSFTNKTQKENVQISMALSVTAVEPSTTLVDKVLTENLYLQPAEATVLAPVPVGYEARFSDETYTWGSEIILAGETELAPVDREGEYYLWLIADDKDLSELRNHGTNKVIVDGTVPTAEISYTAETLTKDDVTAIIILDDASEVEITNNDGENTYTFTENGDFTFQFTDAAGNTGSATATVDWIDKEAPEKLFITADPAMPTNGNVSVALGGAEREATSYISTDGENYTAYTGAITIEDNNTTVSAYQQDVAGNKSEVAELTIDWIDKEAPIVTGVETETYYNEPVTVTYNEGIGFYKFNDSLETFPLYSGTEFTEEGRYSLNVLDEADNLTEVEFIIDMTAPTAEISYTEETLTNENVTATIELTDLRPITITNNEGQNTYTFTGNSSFTFQFTDAAGNTGSATATVDWIDKVAPSQPVIETVPGSITKENVTVTLSGLENGAEAYISTDGENYTAYTGAITVKNNNTTVYAYQIDEAGNNSEVAELTIDWIDKVAPIITGVETETYYNEPVTVTYNEGQGYYSLNEGAEVTFDSGSTLDQEGSYVLRVTDAAGNETAVEFVIDTTPPEISGVTDGSYYKQAVTIGFDEGTAQYSFDNNEAVTIENGENLSDEGSYLLTATDEAGNETTVEFVIDTTPPAITGVLDEAAYNVNVKPIFEGIGSLIQDGGEAAAFESGTLITTDGVYKLTVTDKALNETIVDFIIDTQAPVVTGVVNNTIYNIDVIPVFAEEIALLSKEGESSINFISQTPITEDGAYLLVVTDAAGNDTVINFVIDKTPPTVTGVEDESWNKTTVAAIFSEGTATLQKDGEEAVAYLTETEVSAEGTYSLIVADAVGNETIIDFVIDMTAPEISGVQDGALSNTNITLTFNEGVGVMVFNDGDPTELQTGQELTTDGVYAISVSDLAQNTTTIAFEIDQTAPSITLTDGDLTIGLNGSYSEPGYEASDIRDGDLTEVVVVGGDTVDVTTAGAYVVTYNVSDESGNSAQQQTRTVTVEDLSSMTITAEPGTFYPYDTREIYISNAKGSDGDYLTGEVTVEITSDQETYLAGSYGSQIVTLDVSGSGTALVSLVQEGSQNLTVTVPGVTEPQSVEVEVAVPYLTEGATSVAGTTQNEDFEITAIQTGATGLAWYLTAEVDGQNVLQNEGGIVLKNGGDSTAVLPIDFTKLNGGENVITVGGYYSMDQNIVVTPFVVTVMADKSFMDLDTPEYVFPDETFALNISGAVNNINESLNGNLTVRINSDNLNEGTEGLLYDGLLNFNAGIASVDLALTQPGNQTLWVTVEGIKEAEDIGISVLGEAPMGLLLNADDGPGFIGTVYTDNSNLYYAKYMNEVWYPGIQIASVANGEVKVDGLGRVHLAYKDIDNYLYYRVIDDNGVLVDAVCLSEDTITDYDLAIDDNGCAHLVYSISHGALDDNNDSYAEIMYTTNTSGSFQRSEIYDGWYYYDGGKTGRYYEVPVLTIGSTGNLYIGSQHKTVDGGMGWTETYYYALMKSNSFTNDKSLKSYHNLKNIIENQPGEVYALSKNGNTLVLVNDGGFTDLGVIGTGTAFSLGLLETDTAVTAYRNSSGNLVTTLHNNGEADALIHDDLVQNGSATALVDGLTGMIVIYTGTDGKISLAEVQDVQVDAPVLTNLDLDVVFGSIEIDMLLEDQFGSTMSYAEVVESVDPVNSTLTIHSTEGLAEDVVLTFVELGDYIDFETAALIFEGEPGFNDQRTNAFAEEGILADFVPFDHDQVLVTLTATDNIAWAEPIEASVAIPYFDITSAPQGEALNIDLGSNYGLDVDGNYSVDLIAAQAYGTDFLSALSGLTAVGNDGAIQATFIPMGEWEMMTGINDLTLIINDSDDDTLNPYVLSVSRDSAAVEIYAEIMLIFFDQATGTMDFMEVVIDGDADSDIFIYEPVFVEEVMDEGNNIVYVLFEEDMDPAMAGNAIYYEYMSDNEISIQSVSYDSQTKVTTVTLSATVADGDMIGFNTMLGEEEDGMLTATGIPLSSGMYQRTDGYWEESFMDEGPMVDLQLYSDAEMTQIADTFQVGDTVYVEIDDMSGPQGMMVPVMISSGADSNGISVECYDLEMNNLFVGSFTVTGEISSSSTTPANLQVDTQNGDMVNIYYSETVQKMINVEAPTSADIVPDKVEMEVAFGSLDLILTATSNGQEVDLSQLQSLDLDNSYFTFSDYEEVEEDVTVTFAELAAEADEMDPNVEFDLSRGFIGLNGNFDMGEMDGAFAPDGLLAGLVYEVHDTVTVHLQGDIDANSTWQVEDVQPIPYLYVVNIGPNSQNSSDLDFDLNANYFDTLGGIYGEQALPGESFVPDETENGDSFDTAYDTAVAQAIPIGDIDTNDGRIQTFYLAPDMSANGGDSLANVENIYLEQINGNSYTIRATKTAGQPVSGNILLFIVDMKNNVEAEIQLNIFSEAAENVVWIELIADDNSIDLQTNISVDGTISWTELEDATEYFVKIYKNDEHWDSVTVTNAAFLYYAPDFYEMGAGVYSATTDVIGGIYENQVMEAGSTYIVEKQPLVTGVSFTGTVLHWDNLGLNNGVTIQLYSGASEDNMQATGDPINTLFIGDDGYDLSQYITEEICYGATVIADGSEYTLLPSDESEIAVLNNDATAPNKDDPALIVADNNSNGIYDDGDIITLKFSEEIDFNNFTNISDLVLSAGTWGNTSLENISTAGDSHETSYLAINLQEGASIAGLATVTLAANVVVDLSGNEAESDLVYTLPELDQPSNAGPTLTIAGDSSITNTDGVVVITYPTSGFENYYNVITQVHADYTDDSYAGMIPEADWSVFNGQITIHFSENSPIKAAGDYKIRVKATGYDENVSGIFAVVAGDPAQLAFADETGVNYPQTNPGTLAAVTVEVLDVYGNKCIGLSEGNVTASEKTGYLSDGMWNLGGTTAAAINGGEAVFNDLQVESIGSQQVYLIFNSGDLDSVFAGITIPIPTKAQDLVNGFSVSDTPGFANGIVVTLGEPSQEGNTFKYINTSSQLAVPTGFDVSSWTEIASGDTIDQEVSNRYLGIAEVDESGEVVRYSESSQRLGSIYGQISGMYDKSNVTVTVKKYINDIKVGDDIVDTTDADGWYAVRGLDLYYSDAYEYTVTFEKTGCYDPDGVHTVLMTDFANGVHSLNPTMYGPEDLFNVIRGRAVYSDNLEQGVAGLRVMIGLHSGFSPESQAGLDRYFIAETDANGYYEFYNILKDTDEFTPIRFYYESGSQGYYELANNSSDHDIYDFEIVVQYDSNITSNNNLVYNETTEKWELIEDAAEFVVDKSHYSPLQ